MLTKTCSHPNCAQSNPQSLDQFHKNPMKSDGLTPECISCREKPIKNHSPLDRYLKWKYGITEKEYEIMLDVQKNRCSLCLKHKSEFKIRFYVDHDHKTGKVRSLLCGPCNQALGLMKDNPDLLRRAADYLEYHFEPPSPYKCYFKDGVLVKEDRDDHLPPLVDSLPKS